MFIVKNLDILKKLGFKEYRSGYSKKITLCDGFEFIDVLFEDLVLKKVKFVENKFIYEISDKIDLHMLIYQSLQKDSKSAENYIKKYFKYIEREKIKNGNN